MCGKQRSWILENDIQVNLKNCRQRRRKANKNHESRGVNQTIRFHRNISFKFISVKNWDAINKFFPSSSQFRGNFSVVVAAIFLSLVKVYSAIIFYLCSLNHCISWIFLSFVYVHFTFTQTHQKFNENVQKFPQSRFLCFELKGHQKEKSKMTNA